MLPQKQSSHKSFMIKSLKKNQIVIFAVALMLVTAGYLNFSMKTEQTAEAWSTAEQEQIAGIGDAKLVSNNNVIEEDSDVASTESDASSAESNEITTSANNTNVVNSLSKEDKNAKENSTQTSANTIEQVDKYFSESRLEREKMYSEMLETNQKILAETNVSTEQRHDAQVEISKLNSQKNAIMIAENLIKNKGFKDIIIFVNNESVSVVVRADALAEADIAQIQSIVQRELEVEVQNIHISNK